VGEDVTAPQFHLVTGESMAFYLVVPTFRREEALQSLLTAVGQQTFLPRLTIVVDNASSDRCAQTVESLAAQNPQLRLLYVDAGDNTGSAGGTAIGMKLALDQAADHDWIMRCDDDQLPPTQDFFQTVLTAGERCLALHPSMGGLGRNGARYDSRSSRLIKPPHDPDRRFVPVDYLATNWFPIYRVRAVRDVGVFRSDLFFGFTEFEYGLRMSRGGYHLYRLDLPEHNRKGPRATNRRLEAPTWRRYYSLRNHIVISREYYGTFSALRVAVVTGLLKPLANILTTPRLAFQHLRLNLRAINDARRGRLGRTLEPTLIDGALDLRHRSPN
jgi:GT2 family glycosyltransferase